MSYYYSNRYNNRYRGGSDTEAPKSPQKPSLSPEQVVKVQAAIASTLALEGQYLVSQLDLCAPRQSWSWEPSKRILLDIRDFMTKTGRCSEAQGSLVGDIIDRFAAVPQAIAASDDWAEDFSDSEEMKLNFSRCCFYYSKYWSLDTYGRRSHQLYDNIWNKWSDNPQYIPTPQEYRVIVENKYSEKVLEAYSKAPRFRKGEHVLIRQGSSVPSHRVDGNNRYTKPGDTVQVIKTNRPVTSALKNGSGKKYLCLVVGTVKTVEFEERHLKPMPKSRKPTTKKAKKTPQKATEATLDPIAAAKMAEVPGSFVLRKK